MENSASFPDRELKFVIFWIELSSESTTLIVFDASFV